MTTQYYTASSLDGFIATEDHSFEWLFPLTMAPAKPKHLNAIPAT